MARYIGTIKKTEKGRNPRNKPIIPNKPSAKFGARPSEGTRTGNRAKDFAKVYSSTNDYFSTAATWFTIEKRAPFKKRKMG